MGEVKGFLTYKRQEPAHRPVEQRVHDFAELDLPLTPDEIHQQAARCMDCGIPFCHGTGCPLGNSIPDLNEMVYKGQWDRACRLLHATNNFPEITARVCPAPCEAACTLSVNDEPVLIRHIEYQIVERGFEHGWIKPQPAQKKTSKHVAVIGSGPAGLAAAQQLVRAGHDVIVFEKDEQPGGLLRYGIPYFKLEKHIINRRLDQLIAEGVEFQTSVNVGADISAAYLRKMFDCVLLTMGARQSRGLVVPGAELENVVFAMDYLTAQNRYLATKTQKEERYHTCKCVEEKKQRDPTLTCGEYIGASVAKDKIVVVIGGGDTGSDCVGTARRQGAKKIIQLEILPKPPENRPPDTPWPMWPRIMRTSSCHEEGCERRWSVLTKRLTGHRRVQQLHGCQVDWIKTSPVLSCESKNGGWKMAELPGTDFVLETDLVLLAMGFLHVEHGGLIKNLGLRLDEKGNVIVDNFQTSESGIFAAGDAVSGASLVVRAIASGRQAASAIDQWLWSRLSHQDTKGRKIPHM